MPTLQVEDSHFVDIARSPGLLSIFRLSHKGQEASNGMA